MRADRQPEFTQIDMEMSFADVDDVIGVNEKLLQKLFKEVCNFDVPSDSKNDLERGNQSLGSDKPDLRFGMELKNVTELVRNCGFGVFTGAIENGSSAVLTQRDRALCQERKSMPW